VVQVSGLCDNVGFGVTFASYGLLTFSAVDIHLSEDRKGVHMSFQMIRTAAAVALSVASFGVLANDVTGAGATFPAPVYAKWAAAYNTASGVRINYQSVGSSAGIRQIKAKTVDFGASDMPLTDEELAKEGLIQFPTVIGGVVPVVNIQGVKAGELKLTGEVLGNIYLGKIAKWNDPAIVAPEPGRPSCLTPALRRFVVLTVRAPPSCSPTICPKVNAEWKQTVGEGAAVKWPTGAGGKGNEGVSAFVGRLPNSIGYVEYAYAKTNKLAHVSMKNVSGEYVQPDDSAPSRLRLPVLTGTSRSTRC
jgi:phosphate transport system substrate-binding protein